ncbi:MAG TPA: hypothetical protein PLL11_00050 [Spirochaetota bacterium]|nr:hypothetical protein [Spirochaetota bacterium]
MKKIFNLVMAIFMLAGMSLLSCADDESRPSLAGDATVIINLGLPPEYETVNASIIDRVLRFFTRDAVAAPAPAAFGNISIRVTGNGIGSIAKDFPSTGVISMTVPGGGPRTFEVTAIIAPGDPSAIFSFYGSTIANVPSGGTVNIPILMSLNETKLLVPDRRNNRLVLLDNLSLAGWNTTITTSELGAITGGFYPHDIDYDSRGRIYIANWVSSGTDIIRMDDLNGSNLRQFDINFAGVFNLTNVIGVAIDRSRDILYCISSTELFKVPLASIENNNMVGVVRLDNPSDAISSNLYGIDVDEDGFPYIVNGLTGNWRITKYNPDLSTAGIMYQLAFPSLNWGYDIKIEKPYIYVLNSSGAADYQVLKYHIDYESPPTATYSLVDHFGTNTTTANLADGMFYGPRKFVGIRNDGLFIINNKETVTCLCKMIRLGTLPSLGSGWSAFGAHGGGAGQFRFYSNC